MSYIDIQIVYISILLRSYLAIAVTKKHTHPHHNRLLELLIEEDIVRVKMSTIILLRFLEIHHTRTHARTHARTHENRFLFP